MEAGEPIRVFTLTMVEAEILSRARRLTPQDRLRLVETLRKMTGAPAPMPGRKGSDPPDAQRGATR